MRLVMTNEEAIAEAKRLENKDVRTYLPGLCGYVKAENLVCGYIDAAHGPYHDSKGVLKQTHKFVPPPVAPAL